ncbi:Rne/Rng family ribonuclease [Nocardioides sp.]|uniref:Rne/Rng family ribonuclease n=1 Tax=Nocardioides sp. TaxID=35761 RepID=UPI002C9E01F4|nr:Rne/Rng family ribonuclease [Nocardioides sp.]HXH79817.1 Rne/Rng family ribonuclease [Nocardioides sp.]
MLDDNPNDTPTSTPESDDSSPVEASAPARPVVKRTTRKAATRKTASPASAAAESAVIPEATALAAEEPVETPAAPTVKKTTRTRSSATRKTAAKQADSVQDSLLPDSPGDSTSGDVEAAGPVVKKTSARKAAAKTPAAKKTTAKKTAAKKTSKKAAPEGGAPEVDVDATATDTAALNSPTAAAPVPLFQAPVVATRRTRSSAKKAASAPVEPEPTDVEPTDDEALEAPDGTTADTAADASAETATDSRPAKKTTTRKRTSAKKAATPDPDAEGDAADAADTDGDTDGDTGTDTDTDGDNDENGDGTGPARRRRRRGGRRRRKGGEGGEGQNGDSDSDSEDETDDDTEASGASSSSDADQNDQGEGTSRRRRRRRRAGEEGAEESDEEPNTVTRVRSRRSAEDQITAVAGSTRLEAKKQRRREGREAGRRRAPIVSEAEFLARREAVERVMVVRQRNDLTQIAVLEDKVLVEHYVARESQTSLIGNVYLGRVQNVLPSMEAAFIDIGKGRNAVLYAGEVNWSALGHKEGQPRKIESFLSSGQSILVQVTKDPIGHKGARLTSQISLAGRFLVYVPDGTTSGISRKLPDTERNRLKTLLKEIVPDTAGVIVRTAAEGASEDELTRDVERLRARWEDIEAKVAAKSGNAQLLYGEPDLTLKVVRDLFTEDFSKLVIEGPDAWDTVQGYVSHVAPDLEERLEKFEPATEGRDRGKDIFATYRIDEQIQKGLDRKVWLPSGGSLIIDRTEAMTVVDVNTGKFTGSGGNLEETVTKNNLEAAEEMVRQLRLRDIGGIIVIDFIDMVLESNRDLVVRRLVECLGRDRTRHQVAEVTSLGLVQMTRKRIGTGLLESFSTDCEHCQGRGVVIVNEPVEPKSDEGDGRGARRGRGRGRGEGQDDSSGGNNKPAAKNSNGNTSAPSPKDVAAMPRSEKAEGTDVPDQADQTDAPVDAEPTTPVVDAPVVEEQAVEEKTTKVKATEVKATEVTATEVKAPEEESAPAPAEESAPAEPVTDAEPEKPRVVTRTRRRSATRPAGPPAVPSADGAGAASAGADGQAVNGSGEAGDEAPHVEHVPIKKKGTRKR